MFFAPLVCNCIDSGCAELVQTKLNSSRPPLNDSPTSALNMQRPSPLILSILKPFSCLIPRSADLHPQNVFRGGKESQHASCLPAMGELFQKYLANSNSGTGLGPGCSARVIDAKPAHLCWLLNADVPNENPAWISQAVPAFQRIQQKFVEP